MISAGQNRVSTIKYIKNNKNRRLDHVLLRSRISAAPRKKYGSIRVIRVVWPRKRIEGLPISEASAQIASRYSTQLGIWKILTVKLGRNCRFWWASAWLASHACAYS